MMLPSDVFSCDPTPADAPARATPRPATRDRRAVTVQRLDGGCLLYTLPSATRTRTQTRSL
jgi:hypothetical protein